MGKKEINKQKENLGLEAYVKIFPGMVLLGHERESGDMMLNDTSSETETHQVDTEKKKISEKIRFFFSSLLLKLTKKVRSESEGRKGHMKG